MATNGNDTSSHWNESPLVKTTLKTWKTSFNNLKINKKYDIQLHFIPYYAFWNQIMMFQAFMNLFYMLSPQHGICWFRVYFLSLFSWGCYLGFLLYNFFFLVSFISEHFYTLILVFLYTCEFFNIFWLMLPAPICCSTKFIFLDAAFETIIM